VSRISTYTECHYAESSGAIFLTSQANYAQSRNFLVPVVGCKNNFVREQSW
jgi:hypothetical protein